MFKRVFCFLAAVWLLVAPVLASYNTIGVVQSDLTFLGLSITSGRPGSLSSYGFFSASDGVCYKRYSNSAIDYDLSRYQYLSFIFDCSQVIGECDISTNLVVAAPDFTCDSFRLIGGVLSDGIYNYTYLNYYDFTWFNPSNNEFASVVLKDISADLTNYDIVVFQLHNSSSTAVLDTSFSFSESASISGSYSGTNDASTISVSSQPSSAWELVINVDQYSTVLYEYGTGQYRWWDGNMGITSAYVNTPFHAGSDGIKFTEAASSESGTMSLSETGTISASSATDVMAYGVLSATYGNDGGLVDEVFDIGDTLDSIEAETFDQGETLDQIAGDMSQIVEDMQAKQDAANDIGGATSEDQISGTQETMSSGMSGLTSGLDVVQDIATISAPASSYITLLTATVSPMLNFGNGVLYWALFAVIIGSVILFILRRLE